MAEESPDAMDKICSWFKGLYDGVKRENPALVEPLENLATVASSAYSTLNRNDATASDVVGAVTQLVGTCLADGAQIYQAVQSGEALKSITEITYKIPDAANAIATYRKYEPLLTVSSNTAPGEESLVRARLVDLAADSCAILQKLGVMNDFEMDEFLQKRREELIEANNGNDGELRRLFRSYVMKTVSYHIGHNYFGPVGAGVVGAATAGLIDLIGSKRESTPAALDETTFAELTQKAIAYALEGRAGALQVEQWYLKNEIRAFEEVIKMRLSFDKQNKPLGGHEVWTVLQHNATGKWYFGVNQNARQHFKGSKGVRGGPKGNAYVQLTEPDEPLPVSREAETCAEMHAFAQLLVDQQLLKTVFEAVKSAKFIDKKTKDAFKDIENMSKLKLKQNSSDDSTTKGNEGDETKETLNSQQGGARPKVKKEVTREIRNMASHLNQPMREQPRKATISWQRFELRFDPPNEKDTYANVLSKSKPEDGRPRGRELLNRLLFASFFLISPIDKLINDTENMKKLMDQAERKKLLNPILESEDVFERDRARLLNALLQDESGKQIVRKKKKCFEEFVAHPAVVAYCDARSDAYLLNEIAGIDLTNTTIYTFARKEDGTWTNRGRCGNCQARDSLMGKVTTDPSTAGVDVPVFPEDHYYPFESDMYEALTLFRLPDYYRVERVFMTNEQYEARVRDFEANSRILLRGLKNF